MEVFYISINYTFIIQLNISPVEPSHTAVIGQIKQTIYFFFLLFKKSVLRYPQYKIGYLNIHVKGMLTNRFRHLG